MTLYKQNAEIIYQLNHVSIFSFGGNLDSHSAAGLLDRMVPETSCKNIIGRRFSDRNHKQLNTEIHIQNKTERAKEADQNLVIRKEGF